MCQQVLKFMQELNSNSSEEQENNFTKGEEIDFSKNSMQRRTVPGPDGSSQKVWRGCF